NLLEALRQTPNTRIMIVSSSEVYGQITTEQLPVTEEHTTYPNNPYGISKMVQELLGQQYLAAEGFKVYIARPFNHIGAGQSHRFAIANFAAQIARMEKGLQPPILEVGNLAAERDFTDVRDTVRAYDLIMQKGRIGEPYNIGSGKSYSIRALVDMLIAIAKIKVSIRVDESRLRPIDVPRIVADASRLTKETGWRPQIPIEQTIHDILEDARQSLSNH
ncbi:MAG: GDP-mannose 4,6-dehydratase, partial [Phototrophicales bacterium]